MIQRSRWSALIGLVALVAVLPVCASGTITPSPRVSGMTARLADAPKTRAEQLAEIKKELQALKFDLKAIEFPRLSQDFDTLQHMADRIQASTVTIRTDSVKAGMVVRGSGFFVTATGTGKTGACEIATDNHVLEETTGKTRIYLQDGSELVADVELNDVANDIAVLKIHVANPAAACPVLPLGTSTNLKLPSAVMRVSPDGVVPGVYASTAGRTAITTIPIETGEDANRDIMVFEMPSAPGNSGSAIVGVDGTVISLTWGGGEGVTTGGTKVESLQRDLDKIHAGK